MLRTSVAGFFRFLGRKAWEACYNVSGLYAVRQSSAFFLTLLLAFPQAAANAAGFVFRRPAAASPVPSFTASARPAPAEGFEEGSFTGADGAQIRYLFRRGTGPAVLVVHGTILAGEAQKQGVRGFFPGRPVLAMYRRGYSPSGLTPGDSAQIGPANVADIDKAVSLARELGGGEKVGILAFSLGAMLLPPTDPNKILWVALINPAAPDMVSYMAPDKQTLSWGLKNTYALSRYWYPSYKDAWTRATSRTLADDLIDRIREQQPVGDEAFADSLVDRIRLRMERKDFQELIIQERLWALFPQADMNIPKGVPVLIAASRSDGLIPSGAHDALVGRLGLSASWVKDVRWPGGHLTPMFAPDLVLRELDIFDRKVRN